MLTTLELHGLQRLSLPDHAFGTVGYCAHPLSCWKLYSTSVEELAPRVSREEVQLCTLVISDSSNKSRIYPGAKCGHQRECARYPDLQCGAILRAVLDAVKF